MATLYRKYRPQTFGDVTGQEHIIQTITNEIATGKVAHAYLFSGPRGVGKTTTARLLAKAVNCAQLKTGAYEPCADCSSCLEIAAGRNIDVMEIDAASQTGVDNVRENIIENSRFRPTKSKYKIFIIDEVHMLSGSAFTALLKILEEPPAYVIFILATTEPFRLPDTVISRCQRFAFKKIGHEQMLKRLQSICAEENVKVEKEVLQTIMHKSDGCLRDAESLLGQIMSLGLKKITPADTAAVLPLANMDNLLNFTECLINKQAGEAIKILDQSVSEGLAADEFAYDLIEILRSMLLAKASGAENYLANYSPEQTKKISQLNKQLTMDGLIALLEAALLKRQQIKLSPLPQLPLEILAAQFSAADNGQNKNDTADRPQPKSTAKEQDTILSQSPATRTETDAAPTAEITKINKIITTLEQVKNKWSEIMNELSVSHPSLIFILKMCRLQRMDISGLNISVPFSLHRDRLAEPKNKKTLEDKLQEKFGEPIPVICEADRGADPELAKLAMEFGGELV